MLNLNPLVRRSACRTYTVAALLAGLLLLLNVASASASGPRLTLDTLTRSTAAPGSELPFMVNVRNQGDAPTSGAVTLTAKLPSGMTGVKVTNFKGFETSFWSCSGDGGGAVAGATTIECTTENAINPPSEGMQPTVFVASVDPGAQEGQVLTAGFEVSGGGAPSVSTVDPTRIEAAEPGFGLDAFDVQGFDSKGAASTQAGGHPEELETSFDLNTRNEPAQNEFFEQYRGSAWPVEPMKDAIVDLPPGLLGNPTAVDQCTMGELVHQQLIRPKSLCPPESQIGTAFVRTTNPTIDGPVPVFNMVPPGDVPARFAFDIAGIVVTLDARVRSGSDYGISIDTRNTPGALATDGTTVTIWGEPASPSHDAERACPGEVQPAKGGPTCGTTAAPAAFLRNPTSCTASPGSPVQDGLLSAIHIDSWLNPGGFEADGSPNLAQSQWQSATSVSHQPPGYPAAPQDRGAHQLPTGCGEVPFEPSFSAVPTVGPKANEPTGFSIDLGIPQSDEASAIASSDLKKAVVTLPEGVRISPSSANGLGSCSAAQFDIHSGVAPSCPDASRIGSVSIATPLLEQPLQGGVFLATPHENPFGSQYAIYLVAKGSGVVIKLPGKVEADPVTGRLTTTFDDNPQLPFSNLHLELDSGPRAPLVSPSTCGTKTTEAVLTPWSGTAPVPLSSSYTISGNCVNREGEARFQPGFEAGSVNPLAGITSPFVVHLTRGEDEQRFASVSTAAPEGLTAYLKGIPYCPDSALAPGRISSLSGRAEEAAPSCPAASQVGIVDTAAGAGPLPFHAPGKVYLAGPYKGAPISLAFLVPAVAGPFDLGDVLVRAATEVNPTTAQVVVKSDSLPTMLEGIPLDIRGLSVNLNRTGFALNPTSCEPTEVKGTAASTAGATAGLATHYQVTGCRSLGFKPRLTLTLKGKTGRTGFPQLTARMKAKPGQANISGVSVTLPHSEFLASNHLNHVCTRVQFGEDRCPKGSVYGFAVAKTPLLDEPLRGPVYLRSNGGERELPDLVAALKGQIEIDLVGYVDSVNGGLRTRFATVPDAPVSSFTLKMKGGSHGLLENSTDLCRGHHRATVAIAAHNGRREEARPALKVKKCGGGKGR